MSHRFRHLLPALCLVLLCGVAVAAPPPATTSLTWRGDIATGRSLMSSLDKAWSRSGHPSITLQPFSTISGIDAALDGKADIAGSARTPFPRRTQEAGLTFTPVAWDALVMIVHRSNPVRDVSLKQLRDIYYGKIDNWKALGGPDQPINLYSVASPLDGIEYSLREVLFRRGDQPVASPRLYINTSQLEAAVGIDPLALGVSTMSGVMDNKQLAMLSIEHVAASPTSVANGSYPLYTPLYLAVPLDAPQQAQINAFLAFLGTDKAQQIMRQHHLLPYDPDSLLAQSRNIHLLAMQDLSHPVRDGPVAAPGATFASRSAVAPTSERTQTALGRLEARRAQEAVEKAHIEAADKKD